MCKMLLCNKDSGYLDFVALDTVQLERTLLQASNVRGNTNRSFRDPVPELLYVV
jgi:hypothetical protein